MSVVDRKAILLQLQEEPTWSAMAEEDRAVCIALYEAIQTVQRPQLFGELPSTVRNAVLRWRKTKVRAHRTSGETIRAQLRFADELKLLRTRGNTGKGPTAFEWVGKRLRISANTVANKASRKLPKTTRKR